MKISMTQSTQILDEKPQRGDTSYLYANSGHELAGWMKHLRDIGDQRDVAARSLERVRRARDQVREAFGVEWRNKTLLDVGAGQQLRQSLAMGFQNRVTAIDLELPLQGWIIPDLLVTAWRNGAKRAIKTLARQMLMVDRNFRRELLAQSGQSHLPRLDVSRMDATRLDFPDNSFDGAFSFSVFQHIDRPDRAAAEMQRVVAPGGVAYVELHLYSSLRGSDHPLLRTAPRSVPPWAHLRKSSPLYRKHGLYVNMLRLAEWKSLFEKVFGDVKYFSLPGEQNEMVPLLSADVRSELSDFTEEELLTSTVIAVGRKRMK
jgi:SAM-dependent methyltransferase